MPSYKDIERSLLPRGSCTILTREIQYQARSTGMPSSCPYLERVLSGRQRPLDLQLLKQGLADGTTKPSPDQWRKLAAIVEPLWGEGILILE